MATTRTRTTAAAAAGRHREADAPTCTSISHLAQIETRPASSPQRSISASPACSATVACKGRGPVGANPLAGLGQTGRLDSVHARGQRQPHVVEPPKHLKALPEIRRFLVCSCVHGVLIDTVHYRARSRIVTSLSDCLSTLCPLSVQRLPQWLSSGRHHSPTWPRPCLAPGVRLCQRGHVGRIQIRHCCTTALCVLLNISHALPCFDKCTHLAIKSPVPPDAIHKPCPSSRAYTKQQWERTEHKSPLALRLPPCLGMSNVHQCISIRAYAM